MGLCNKCYEKQLRIDALEQEVASLRAKLKYRTKQQEEGFFGSSTPSAKQPVKPNTKPEKEAKRKGARPGHTGHAREGYPLLFRQESPVAEW